MNKQIVIDAAQGTLGRIASYASKQALLGKTIAIVNCNEVLIAGKREATLKEYKKKRARGGSSLNGPNFPKHPERIMKRTIRGMLSYKQGRGSSALDKIKCYNTIPSEFESSEKISLKREIKVKAITLKELSKIL